MSFFGLSTKKEVEAQKQQARESEKRAVLQGQQTDLANLGKGSQIKFSIPFFDVFDPRFENFAVPVAVHGSVVYAVDNIELFNSKNKTQNMNDGVFQEKLKAQLTKYVKSVITNAPSDNNIQVLKMERMLHELSELSQRLVSQKIEELFGVNIRSLDITQINVEKDSPGYQELRSVTSELEGNTLKAMSAMNIDAMQRQHEMQFGGQEEMQRMQLEHQRETMRIQREELQRSARLQTETNFLSAHQANLSAGGGMFAQYQSQSAQQMPQMPQMSGMPSMPQMPSYTPQVQYMVNINNQPSGPFGWDQLKQLVQNGQLMHQTPVWKQGMAQWQCAGEIQELLSLFN